MTISTASSAFSLWDVDRLDMEYYKYRPGYRNPYFVEYGSDKGDGYAPMVMDNGAELHLDVSSQDVLYWRNRFHMATDQNKHVKHVGWEWEWGVNGSRWKAPVDLFVHHHSQHGLEYINPRGDRFPVEDTYGIRFKLIEGRGK